SLTPLATRLVRMTKSLQSELGKQINADIEFGDLLVSPEIGRVISDILVHVVRNSADHGIEPPDDRAAASKDPTGTIRVRARADGNRVALVVTDDGRGIDVAKVRNAALRRGFDPERVASASDAEVIDMLFTPGFSTAPGVTAVSGRGVGLDVVKCLAEE